MIGPLTMTELDRWFMDEILTHEAALTRFLKRNCADPAEVADLRQETYARAYDAARKALPVYAKSHLFGIARNLMIDKLRRSKVIAIDAVADLEALHVASEDPGPDRQFQGRQDLARLSAALDQLPPRCREVVVLRKIERLSQREIATRMGISENTVEHQVVKGTRLLADIIFGHSRPPRGKSAPGSTKGERGW
jgi:RNA polymerase sigma-70 factor (ECF subfamily)